MSKLWPKLATNKLHYLMVNFPVFFAVQTARNTLLDFLPLIQCNLTCLLTKNYTFSASILGECNLKFKLLPENCLYPHFFRGVEWQILLGISLSELDFTGCFFHISTNFETIVHPGELSDIHLIKIKSNFRHLFGYSRA